mmetsp:Transcript_29466/g.93809  ORF Transcript_29466/g.93809 Transcript_29466/m.93809 type:complete len:211 (+) Transcript_29466:386-1018(+)
MSMVHAFAEMRLTLQVDAWLQWVPSKANIADLPSRGEFDLLHRLRSRETPLVLPDMDAFAHPIGVASALALRLPAAGLGSIAVAHVRCVQRRHGDVDARRGRGPLGNPFPLAPGASRPTVCDAFARVLRGEDPAHVARDRPGPPLPFYAELAGPAARDRRERALEDLARTVAQGGRIRLLCVCFPKQCHAMSIAVHVRARAHQLAAPRTG